MSWDCPGLIPRLPPGPTARAPLPLQPREPKRAVFPLFSDRGTISTSSGARSPTAPGRFSGCEFLPLIYKLCLQLLPTDIVPLTRGGGRLRLALQAVWLKAGVTAGLGRPCSTAPLWSIALARCSGLCRPPPRAFPPRLGPRVSRCLLNVAAFTYHLLLFHQFADRALVSRAEERVPSGSAPSLHGRPAQLVSRQICT